MEPFLWMKIIKPWSHKWISWGYKILVTWNLVSMDQYGSNNNLIRFMAQFDRVMYWALILTHEALLSEMLLGYSFLSVPVGECLGWFPPRILADRTHHTIWVRLSEITQDHPDFRLIIKIRSAKKARKLLHSMSFAVTLWWTNIAIENGHL